MANPNKRKGTAWEVALRDFLNEALDGLGKVYRPAQEGYKDTGDLHGLSPFIGQAKNWKDLPAALREGTDGAEKQATHAGETYGVAFIKRARRSTGEGYAVMKVRDFAAFLADYRALSAEVTDLRRRLGE